MYRAYRLAEGGHELGIVFRDHALSDLIGFHYQRSDPVAAADDFVSRVRAIGQAVPESQPALVTVILDGENCWEHYPGGGVAFLRALYERCTHAGDLRSYRIGDYLRQRPPSDTLPHLFAGSWISHNFAIWIGHEEDNTGWDALHHAREHLRQREQQIRDSIKSQEGAKADPSDEALSPSHALALSHLRQAWEEIYIAEGSDWFWWYGDEHSSAQDALFDYLFRKHLQNVYLLLGDTPPPELARPISRRSQRILHTVPRAFLDVKVNGRPTFFEWLCAGRYTSQNERGTMTQGARGPIKEILFGFNLQSLLVRVDFDQPARTALADFDMLRVGFLEPSGWELRIERPGAPKPLPRLFREGRLAEAPEVALGIDRVAEIALPFARLGVQVDQPLSFYVELLEGRQSVDRAPREGAIHLTCPSPDFEQIMWNV
jgi:hypothetical protein